MTLKVVVCGGRKYRDKTRVLSALDTVHNTLPIDVMIHGDNDYVDRWSRDWAKQNKIRCVTRPVCWAMKLHPDVVIAFPGGKDTEHMIRQAKKSGVAVIEPEKL